jgi:hypothetical protein
MKPIAGMTDEEIEAQRNVFVQVHNGWIEVCWQERQQAMAPRNDPMGLWGPMTLASEENER